MKRFTIILFFFVMLSAAKHLSAQSPDNPKVKRIDWKETSAPPTITNQARMFFESASDSFKARMPDGTIFVFGGSDPSGNYSPWDTNANGIIQKDPTLSVGIGTTTPNGKLEVLGLLAVTDSIGSGANDYWNYIMGNFGGINVFSALNAGTEDGIYARDSMGNMKTKAFGVINGISYDSRDSTDISCEVGQRLTSNGAHTAQIKFHSNTATGVGHIHFDVRDSAANSIQLHLETTDSVIRLSTNGTAIGIDELAGSGIRLVTTTATGDLGDTTFSLGGAFTIDASNNMSAGTNALPDLTSGAFNFAAGIDAGSGANSGAAVKEGNSNVLIGYGCDVADTAMSSGIAIGFNCITGANSFVAGENAQGTGSNVLSIGGSIITNNSICIYCASTTADYQFATEARNLFLNNVTNATGDDVSITGGGRTGTNLAAGDLILKSPISTGNANPGEIIFQTTTLEASGTTSQSLVTSGKFDGTTTARDTRFLLYDVDNGTLERVTVGDPDSGGSGFKVLRIPN